MARNRRRRYTGPILLNGTFESTSGWVLSPNGGAGTIAVASNQGVVTVTPAGFVCFIQPFPTAIGTVYTVTGNIISGGGFASFIAVRKTDDVLVSINVVTLKQDVNGTFSATFTATAKQTYLVLQVHGGDGQTGVFDDLVVS